MIKHVVAFLLMLIPTVVMANDRCTNPSEYTVDRRCYVDKALSGMSKYGASALIFEDTFKNSVLRYVTGVGWCSGTVVKNNDKFYFYTAHHCLEGDEAGSLMETVSFRLFDGRVMSAKKYKVGDAVLNNRYANGDTGDWAIYEIIDAPSDIPYVEFKNPNVYVARRPIIDDVFTLGYGSLKIMSDSEIADFKKGYFDFLKERPEIKQEGEKAVVNKGESIDAYADPVLDYLMDERGKFYIYKMFLSEEKLKKSECKLDTGNRFLKDCQVWDGDSGGGVFLFPNTLIGVITGGKLTIGGTEHARGVLYVVPEP